jgi:hypothetical protein
MGRTDMPTTNLKKCKTCGLAKSIDNFSICLIKNGNIYYRAECKECRKPKQDTYNQKYYEENGEKRRTQERERYHNGGKEARKAYNKNYGAMYRQNPENKKKNSKRVNEWSKKKRKNEPGFAIRQNVSRAINATLQLTSNTKNGQSFLQFVPWTLGELKQYLEQQFEPWMTWENRGNYVKSRWNDHDPSTWTWNIDHIIPQSDLLYTSMTDDNFKKCWALENLRPYSAKQNIIDGTTKIRHKKEGEK